MVFRFLKGLFAGSEKSGGEEFERNLVFQQAVFQSFEPQSVELKVDLRVNSSGSIVSIEGSGDWSGSYDRNDVGAETFEFETNAAEERITISPTGEAIWELRYHDPEMHQDRVIAFVGMRVEDGTYPASP